MIKVVFFDLDGTLLPMDLGTFIKAYVGTMADHLGALGYDKRKLVECFKCGIDAMLKNDGTMTNEAAFWAAMDKCYGDKISRDIDSFNAYYETTFDTLGTLCGYTPRAREILDMLHEMEIPCVLATSPVYPRVATDRRMRWAGISADDFIAVTSFETSRYAKPNPLYFSALAKELGYLPEECLVVGNDTTDDLAAVEVGMKIFLLTNDLINRDNIDISAYPNGGYDELVSYLKTTFKK